MYAELQAQFLDWVERQPTKTAAARTLGISTSYITEIRKGRRQLSRDLLLRWAEISGHQVMALEVGEYRLIVDARQLSAERRELLQAYARLLERLPAPVVGTMRAELDVWKAHLAQEGEDSPEALLGG